MSLSRLLANRPLVAVFVGAVVIVGLVVGSGYHAGQLMDRRAVVDGLVRSINDDTMESHLWLKEHLAGDDQRLPGGTGQHLAGALGACTTLRVGGRVAGQRVEPLHDDAQPSVAALCDRLVALQELTDRLIADAPQGIESDLHGDYDALSNETLTAADRVADAVAELVQARRGELAALSAALVAAVVVTFFLMTVTVSRHARQLQQAGRRQADSEAWFRALVHSTSDLIVVLDAGGTLLYANPVAEDVLGCSPAEEAGRSVFAHVHPDDRDRTAQAFARWSRQPGTAHPWVVRLESAEGGWRTLEVIVTNCLDDPAVAGVVVNARDVTEAQASRRALDVSESLLREAQRISHVGHWQWDVASHRLDWLAEEIYAIHGIAPDQWRQTSEAYYDFLPLEDHDLLRASVEESLTTGASAVTHRIVRPDGTIRHVRHQSELVRGETGAPQRLVGTCQDVTEQEELARALDERVKELTCLAAVRHVVQEVDDAADVCAAAAAALARAVQHPDVVVATVDLDGRTYGTGEQPGAGEQLAAAIVVDGAERGRVRVGYPCDGAAFLPEEHDLIQSVAATLALWLQRHESAAALVDSEARFRRLVDNVPDVVFRYRLGDGEGMEYISPSVEALTGYTVGEFLDDPHLVRQILVDADAAMDRDSAQDSAGKDNSGAVQVVARDGSVRWLDYHVVPVEDEEGILVAVEGIARDVTERTIADQALQQRAREHAALARFGEAALTCEEMADLFDLAAAVVKETLPVDAVGVTELRPDTGELVVSSGIGWPPGVVGTMRLPADAGSLASAAIATHAPVVVADLADATTPAAPLLAAQGMVSGMSVVIGGRGGPYGTLGAFSARPQEYPDAQVRFLQTLAHLLGAAIERTTAQSALTRSEREFRTLTEQMPDIVARYGDDHRCRYVNPSMEAVLGISPSEMIGRTNRELGMPALSIAVWEDAYDRVFATGEPATVEGAYPGVGGLTRLQSLLIPEFDQLGAVCAVISVSRDITELRRAEEERREGLSRIVAAQEAERGRIGEDIHDDSIQVMTAVGMRLEVLKLHVTEPEALDLLGRLEETVRHSIDRLRTLMFELRPPELDRDGLPATLSLYLEATATDGLPRWEVVDHCTRELPGETLVVLYRIAVEAIVNVRKHAQASLLTVTLDDVDGGVRLQVRDDGLGFDTAGLAEIGPHHVGTATMRGRAGAADGTLDIHSVPGEGTVVTAWLPCPPASPDTS
ncbi:MAG: PAS domain S-box protein [Egibacteraceae bacterium]